MLIYGNLITGHYPGPNQCLTMPLSVSLPVLLSVLYPSTCACLSICSSGSLSAYHSSCPSLCLSAFPSMSLRFPQPQVHVESLCRWELKSPHPCSPAKSVSAVCVWSSGHGSGPCQPESAPVLVPRGSLFGQEAASSRGCLLSLTPSGDNEGGWSGCWWWEGTEVRRTGREGQSGSLGL